MESSISVETNDHAQHSPLDINNAGILKKSNFHNPYICHLNVNSLRNKIHDIRYLSEQLTFEVLTISETKLDVSFPSSQFLIDGYYNPNDLRKDRNAHGGGLITFIKRGIPYKRLHKLEPPQFEIMCIEITFGKRKWGYVAIYRPPNTCIPSFFTALSKCIEALSNAYDHIFISGDINIDTKNVLHSNYHHYDNFIDTFGLKNLIKQNTCFVQRNNVTSSSSIDVILTNCHRKFFHTHTVETGISDWHVLTGTFLRATYRKSDPIEIEYRNYHKYYLEYDNFCNEIKNISLLDSNDPNLVYEKYHLDFRKILDKYAPLKRKKLRGNDAGFANKNLRKAWYTRSRFRNRYNKNPSSENWNLYKKQRNLCTSLKRQAKKDHFLNKTQSSGSFWKIFGKFISNKGHHTQEDFIISINGELENDKSKVSNAFNDRYANIIEHTTGEKPQTFNFSHQSISPIEQIIDLYKDHPSIQLINQKMCDIADTTFSIKKPIPSQIKNIIKDLKSNASQGWDKIPPKVIKGCSDIISEPLSKIIGLSVEENVFIDFLKIALVNPVYKNPKDGSRQNIEHYRPISVLSGFSKIFEKYFLSAILEHTNAILSENISAYRKGYSCEHVLVKLIEEWRKYIDKNKVVGGLLMDLSKAFDCLPHTLLIAKLAAYGFSKNSLSLILSYLNKRKQAVKINGHIGEFLELISGVPQGSILGPILFNLFINDFIFMMENTPTDVFNYADDNTLTAVAKNVKDLLIQLQEGSISALKWLNDNKMIANPDKFKLIILQKPASKKSTLDNDAPKLAVGNGEINPDSSVNLLGLSIDNNLNFKMQIKEMCTKAAAKLNAIKRLVSFQNENDRKLLINAHVISQFQYCTNVWHFCGLTDIHKMERLHERCIRYIYNDYEIDYFDLLIKYNLTTLYGERTRKMCHQIYKTIVGENPSYMKDIFEIRPSKYPTRNENNLYVPTANQNKYGLRSFRVYGPKLWNMLPENIKSIENFIEFKNNLKDIEMPFCECVKCLTMQIGTLGSNSKIAEKLLHDKIFF